MMRKNKETKTLKYLSKISTIHGLSYIGDGKASKFSRIFWILAIILSCVLCFFYFLKVYDKVFIAPDISIKISYKSLKEFPFPAITICPNNKFPHTSINYKENLQKLSESKALSVEEKIELELASQSYKMMSIVETNLHLNLSSSELIRLLSDHQYKTNETIYASLWNKKAHMHGAGMFNRIFTFNGFCSTFNQLDFDEIFTNKIHEDFKIYSHKNKSNWKMSTGYSDAPDDYPHRINYGYKNGIAAALIQDEYKAKLKAYDLQQGFQIYWHLPNEPLTIWHPTANVFNVNKKNKISLKAESFKMSPELRSYDVKHRECYFDGEKSLKFFKIYTERNCKFECLSNFTLKECGCVKYYMPRDKNTPVCMSPDLECANDIDLHFEDDQDCQCYPPCDNIEYEFISRENVKGDQDSDEKSSEETNSTEKPLKTTLLTITFPKNKVEERMSFSAYQMQQFISDFGGLLSLAMGCSILSIVELVYNAVSIQNEIESEDEDEKEETEENTEERKKLSETRL